MEDHFTIKFDFEGHHYEGLILPSFHKNEKGIPVSFAVLLNGVPFGNVSCTGKKWSADTNKPQALVDTVGDYIWHYYE
jgi:hypothetical protein